MKQISERAFAKLNLSLDVTGLREDGYHEMVMLMQSVDLYDEIHIKLNETGNFIARSNLGFLPCNDKNIGIKAARLFLQRAGFPDCGVELDMKKRIPVCAGMGGGSSDGAAVLRGLNKLTGAWS